MKFFYVNVRLILLVIPIFGFTNAVFIAQERPVLMIDSPVLNTTLSHLTIDTPYETELTTDDDDYLPYTSIAGFAPTIAWPAPPPSSVQPEEKPLPILPSQASDYFSPNNGYTDEDIKKLDDLMQHR